MMHSVENGIAAWIQERWSLGNHGEQVPEALPARLAFQRKYLAEQLERYFFGGGADQIGGYVPPAS